MANYCSNSIVFYSKRKKPLEEIRQLVSKCLGDRKLNSVKQFLKFCGLPKVANGEYCDARDYFTNCDASVEKDIGIYCLRVDTESAWSPNMEVFNLMLQEKYNWEVKIVYQSEEPGSDIYINTDSLGIYFADRFKVEYSYQGNTDSSYFTDWRSMVKFLNETFPQAKLCLLDKMETLIKKISRAYKFTGNNGNYININSFDQC